LRGAFWPEFRISKVFDDRLGIKVDWHDQGLRYAASFANREKADPAFWRR
jgi:hypothetical protein